VVSVQVPYDQAASGAPLSSRFCPLGPRDGQAPNGRNPAQHAEGRNSITHAAQEHRDFCTFGLRGIQKEGAHARAKRACFVLAHQAVENRKHEGLGLAGAGCGSHHYVAAGSDLPDRLLLMHVQGTVDREGWARQGSEARREYAVGDGLGHISSSARR
jgi:hypothetical protein